ncbi:PAS domain S-box-containing protein/diguanylate cyclase (GGDEF) domain-containing protein [Halopseudomonas sabulinigri]|uniref:cyclic-guanylate-specific phosphodiesterase n=1 Tax=Halopseudomonas sabulinigri TaxID=472181 RepID=A0A1H1M2T7_9GAMM|nr:EAL domain-containing protein [Halopseudomonas sabulinigri]SDR81071.1 PAS domain S-box-containing protein/diguanylate cyclase (GGDEF) domain-containing protein [Halopseudomonas sabulinigri]
MEPRKPEDPQKQWRILIVEDNEDDALLVVNHLEVHGWSVTWERVEAEDTLQVALSNGEWDVVLSDYSMPLFDGAQALASVRRYSEDLPFIYVSGTLGEKAAVEAIRAGAQDYIVKNDLQRLAPVIQRSVAERAAEKTHRASRQLLRKLSQAVDQAADSIFITDREGRIEYVNPAFERMTGYSAAQANGQLFTLLKAPEQNPEAYDQINQTLRQGRTYRGTLINRTQSGSVFFEEKVISPLVDAEGRITHFVSTGRDVTERIKAEEDRMRLNAILEATTDAVAISDAQGKVMYLNRAGQELFGDASYESPYRVEDQPNHAMQTAQELILSALSQAERHGVVERESMLSLADGEKLYLSEVIMAHRDKSGETAYFSTIARNISERKQFEAELQHQATHDGLTGLANRVMLGQQLQSEIQRAEQRQSRMAVLFLDMDNFKRINDSLGHGTGDLLLQQISGRLSRHIRPKDLLARYGADEFVIVASDLNAPEAIVGVLDKLKRAFEAPIRLAEQDIFLSFTAGVSIWPDDGQTVEALLRNADSAMNQAKAAGGRAFRFYAPAMNERQQDLLALESDLHWALERNEFVIYYQPQADMLSGKVVGMEALLRWQHPERGLIQPDDFIPLLEETGLIVKVGMWVLKQACLDAMAQQALTQLPLRMSVNLSARQFSAGDLAAQVAEVLAEIGFAPNQLELEITEQMLINDLETSAGTLEALQRLGVRVSIDDFGTGYCSLAYLKRFPLHALKIDRTFVSELPANLSDSAIVEATILLAHKLGLEVVAEGVEQPEQLHFLRQLGCNMVQGYYLSKPRPAAELAGMVALDLADLY